MNKGMFISCGGCGYTRHICLDGDFYAREQQLNETLLAGWRYTTTWDGFACPKCARAIGATDELYKLVVGKPRICGTLISYVELRTRADEQLAAFRALG